jgi:hypothetical protein
MRFLNEDICAFEMFNNKSDQKSHVSPHDGQFYVRTSFVIDGQTEGRCTTRLGTDHSCEV